MRDRTRRSLITVQRRPIHPDILHRPILRLDKLRFDHHLKRRLIQLIDNRPDPAHPRRRFRDHQRVAPLVHLNPAGSRNKRVHRFRNLLGQSIIQNHHLRHRRLQIQRLQTDDFDNIIFLDIRITHRRKHHIVHLLPRHIPQLDGSPSHQRIRNHQIQIVKIRDDPKNRLDILIRKIDRNLRPAFLNHRLLRLDRRKHHRRIRFRLDRFGCRRFVFRRNRVRVRHRLFRSLRQRRVSHRRRRSLFLHRLFRRIQRRGRRIDQRLLSFRFHRHRRDQRGRGLPGIFRFHRRIRRLLPHGGSLRDHQMDQEQRY